MTPDLVDPTTGAITPPPEPVDYVVTDPGIDLVGTGGRAARAPRAGTETEWRLFRVEQPLRLQNSTRGVSQDGWAERQSDYSQFTTPGGLPGVRRRPRTPQGLGRQGRSLAGDDPRRRAPRGRDKQPALGAVTDRCTFTINRLEDRTFLLRTPTPPFHVDVRIAKTFVPNELDPSFSDTRRLGAQLEYSFSPAGRRAASGCAGAKRLRRAGD